MNTNNCLTDITFDITGGPVFPDGQVSLELTFASSADKDQIICTEWYIDNLLVQNVSSSRLQGTLPCAVHDIASRILTSTGWSGLISKQIAVCAVPQSATIQGPAIVNEGKEYEYRVIGNYENGLTADLTQHYTFSGTGVTFIGNKMIVIPGSTTAGNWEIIIQASSTKYPPATKNLQVSNEEPLALFMGTEADYIVMQVSADRYTAVATRAFLPTLQGSNASQLIQSCIDSLSSGNGGHVHLCSGTYRLQDELVIRGWNTQNPPVGMIKLTGSGHATVLQQDTAGKNALLCKNKASVTLQDMRINCGPQALSCLLFDDNNIRNDKGEAIDWPIPGQQPVSVWGGVVDNLTCNAQSATHAAVIIRNTFDVSYPHLECINENNDGIRIESTYNGPNTVIYGNSNFGFLKASASPEHAGLRMEGSDNYKSVDMITIANYECHHAKYGVYFNGVSLCTFDFADITDVPYPIYIAGSMGRESLGNTFASGYLHAKGNDARAITVSEFAGGNKFQFFIQSDNDTVPILQDDSRFRLANVYDLTLSGESGNWPKDGIDKRIFFADHTSSNRSLTVRTENNGLTVHVPTPPFGGLPETRVNSQWMENQGFVSKAYALENHVTVDGDNFKDNTTWELDITGSAQKFGGLTGDFNLNNNAPLHFLVGLEAGNTNKFKKFEKDPVIRMLELLPFKQGVRAIFPTSQLQLLDTDYTLIAGGNENFTLNLPPGPKGRILVIINAMWGGARFTLKASSFDGAADNLTLSIGQCMMIQNSDGQRNYVLI